MGAADVEELFAVERLLPLAFAVNNLLGETGGFCCRIYNRDKHPKAHFKTAVVAL